MHLGAMYTKPLNVNSDDPRLMNSAANAFLPLSSVIGGSFHQ